MLKNENTIIRKLQYKYMNIVFVLYRFSKNTRHLSISFDVHVNVMSNLVRTIERLLKETDH